MFVINIGRSVSPSARKLNFQKSCPMRWRGDEMRERKILGARYRQASSLFRTAAAVVWLLSIFQSRRGKRDKPEDVASTCPVSVKLIYKLTPLVFHVEEGKKLRRHKRQEERHQSFLLFFLFSLIPQPLGTMACRTRSLGTIRGSKPLISLRVKLRRISPCFQP